MRPVHPFNPGIAETAEGNGLSAGRHKTRMPARRVLTPSELASIGAPDDVNELCTSRSS